MGVYAIKCITVHNSNELCTFSALFPQILLDSDITKWNCDTSDDCTPRYEQPIYIPEALFAEIEAQVIQTMLGTMQIPSEDSDNKRNINRQ